MKIILLVLLSLFAGAFGSSSTSVIELVKNHFDPIFQQTYQRLNLVVFQFAQKLFDRPKTRQVGSIFVTPAPWVNDLFGSLNPIAVQWNSLISNFFSNIPTIFQPKSRSFFDINGVKKNLEDDLTLFLNQLEHFFTVEIERVLLSLLQKYYPNDWFTFPFVKFTDLQGDINKIFNQTETLLNEDLVIMMDGIEKFWNEFKSRLLTVSY